jgi:GT2 family glycosyltransferase
MMIRRDQLLKAGLFDESLQFWQDYELQIRLCQIGDVGVVRENLVLYRIRSADKERKTNLFDGWMQAVRDIRSKHRTLIQKLPEDMRCRMELHFLEDGIYRAAFCGRDSERQRFLERRSFLTMQLEKAGSTAVGLQE